MPCWYRLVLISGRWERKLERENRQNPCSLYSYRLGSVAVKPNEQEIDCGTWAADFMDSDSFNNLELTRVPV